MEIWKRKPMPSPHVISKISWDTVFCSCNSWSYQCRDADRMPKGVLENELLDIHKIHSVQMKERGL